MITDAIRLEHCVGMFDGRDEDIRARTTTIITTRKPHYYCYSPLNGQTHHIPVGTRALKEHAIVDGCWCSSYSCCDCIDKYLIQEGMVG